MANENEVHTKIREYLTNGDTHGCTVYLEELMRRATRREIRFYGIYFPIKHPVFGELSALEWAVLYNIEELFKIVRNYGQLNNPVLYNFYDVDLDYLATLSGFKLALPATTGGGYRGGQPRFLQREPNYVTVAARLGHTRVLENISNIKRHRESDWTSETSETQRKPLDIAALHNRVEVCRLLLQNQFVQAHAPKLIDLSDYGNALHIAARFGHVAIIHELLDPSNIKTTFWKHTEVLDKLKYTALGLAVLHVHADAVKELVIRGKADVNAAQGLNGLTPLQLILSDDCKYREEFFAVDKFSRDKIIRVLLDAGANQEGLTKEQLAYINELVEREASREHDIDSSEPMVEEEPILSLKTSSDDAVKPPEHASPNKKEPLECLLCDKKFTSAISLQAHLKSKGHVKQERKERLQKRGQPVSIEELDAHERKRIGLIERLPLLSELINLILIKLNKLDLLRFAATSKSIQMLVCKQKLLWNELEVSITWPMWERNEKKLSFFSDIANRLPTLEKFTVKSCNASDEVYNSIFEIPRLCTSLKELDIQRIYRDYPVSWLGGVFQKNTQLTSLKVHRIIPWKRAKVQAVKDGELNPEQPEPAPANPKKPWKKKRVKQVKKPDPRKWMVDLDSVMHSGSTSLQHLTIDVGFPEDVQHDLIVDLTVGIFKRCPNLTSIQLCHTWDNENVTSITLKKLLYGLFDACPKLKRVKLEGEWLFGRLSNDEYDALFKRFGAFESFKLEGDEISNFDRDIHDFIGDYCQNLKALRILHLNAVAFNGPHFGLSSCTNLTELFISKSGEMNEGGDQFLHTITSRCTKIAKLILDIKPVTNAIVQGMAQLGTTLRVLKSKDQQRDHVVNYTPLVRCVNLVKLELQRVTISDAYTIIEHCKHIRDLDLYMVSDEDNPVIQQQLQQQQNNDNQAQDNNNNQAPNNNNNAQQPDDNNNAAPANNNAQNPVANNQEGAQQQQQANNNNNNNPAPPPPVIHKEVDFGLILEKCADLTDMYLYAPMSCDSFSRMVVHTGLTKIRNLSSSSAGLKSDWPIFYLAECCPNLKHLAVDYGFTLTDACEPTFVRRFPKLEVLVGSSSRYCDFFKRVNEQRVNSFFYDY